MSKNRKMTAEEKIARAETKRRRKDERMQKLEDIENEISRIVPQDIIGLYPAARAMQRHFVLHLGETNSGKTYNAMQALKESANGIYLAPLRLLAYEKYEELNNEGIRCDMITGEERIIQENSTHVSSTIEMLNLRNRYSTAVIDECQMICDENRGGAWTSAIMGIQADTIYLCGSQEVAHLIISIIEMCGDTYSYYTHKRETPLIMVDPVDLGKPGDAFIFFSKRNVLAYADDLERKGKKVSVIYSSLPYDVRMNEIKKFNTGQTDILVSTDAIGMGMNLPIRRVIFMELKKFDGRELRQLKPGELKQIAGRAGRKGIYEEGHYTTTFDMGMLKSIYNTGTRMPSSIYIGFPDRLADIDGKLSDIYLQWSRHPVNKLYSKENVDERIELCKYMEKFSDNKGLIYQFANIPFDTKNTELMYMWKELFNIVIKGLNVPYAAYFELNINYTELGDLELAYKKCDLLYNFMMKFKKEDEMNEILLLKEEISRSINKLLQKTKKMTRKCRYCNRIIPDNWAYGVCEECFCIN